jgi:hypothetical protein
MAEVFGLRVTGNCALRVVENRAHDLLSLKIEYRTRESFKIWV